MKSEHRHELQRNDLGQLTLQAKPWFEKHGMQLLGGLVALLAVIGIWLYVASQPKADAAAWGRLSSAQSVDDFGAVADKYPNSVAGLWARLRMAELNLEDGILALFTDRELGLKDLKTAQADFETVVNSKLTLPEAMKQRALLGLARCQEATSDGDTSAALATYKKLLESKDSIYEPHVQQRVKELESGGAKQFYAWFHSQKPKPPDFRKPKDGIPSGLNLPGGDLPDVMLPPPPGKATPKEETPKRETPKEDAPKTDDAVPAGAPKGDTPAEKKADDEKPANP